MTPDERRALITLGLGGQHLSTFWTDPKQATRSATGSASQSSYHWVDRKGIHGAAGTVTWQEVAEVVQAGAKDGRGDVYLEAFRAYVDNAGKGLPEPWSRERANAGENYDEYFTSPANNAYWDEGTRVIRALNDAGKAIIDAGCERTQRQEIVQDSLFDVGDDGSISW